MHYVARHKLGVPQSSRDAFSLLNQHQRLSASTTTRMQAMVGFRNLAVHSYQELQLPILQAILDQHLQDFEAFISELREKSTSASSRDL